MSGGCPRRLGSSLKEAVETMSSYQSSPPVDRGIPLLIVKIGHNPMHHGAVAAARSLGRLGVPVYAVVEDRFTPMGLSRYLTGSFLWPTCGAEESGALVAGLRRIGERLGRPAVALATDDVSADLLSGHRAELADMFLIPRIDAGLPSRLADKQGLYELCRRHAVHAPATVFPTSAAEVRQAIEQLGLPAVAKDCAPWERLLSPTIGGTKVLRDRADVRALEQAISRPGGSRILVQEYLPDDDRPSHRAPDWFVHMYCDNQASPVLVFTGTKLRSWPVGGGFTTRGVATANPELAEATAELCRRIGYRGIGDLDWRYDRRRDRFALVDFNPRIGAQAQVFRTTTGIDLVRALHLDMSGRSTAVGRQIDARELIVEHFNAASVLAGGYRHVPPHPRATHREPAWFAWDDPAPFMMATVRFALDSARWIGSRIA